VDRTGVNKGMLSYFERARWLPTDIEAEALEDVLRASVELVPRRCP
jgi:hypothetical protein